jgi:hypothetical protein
VSVDGSSIVVQGDRPLRAVRLDLTWDASLTVSGIVLGPDDARLDLLRVQMNGNGARVLVSDTRGVHLPQAGTILTIQSTGTGAVKIVDVQAADDSEKLVNVGIK